MKVLIINTNESSGGAAKAANRLHKGLRSIGVESFMLVQRTEKNNEYIIGAKANLFFKGVNFLRSRLDSLPKKIYKDRENVTWSINWLHNPLLFYHIKKIKPDIINLHWVNSGFISIKQINKLKKLNIPLVWTLHDMWPFTGGCHYSGDCNKYVSNCKSCPQLGSKKNNDLSNYIFNTKKKYYPHFNIVCLCEWMKNCVKSSHLLSNSKINIIPNGFDLNIFKPRDINKTREIFSLPKNKKIILFGAVDSNDKRKGLFFLEKALNKINNKNYAAAIFGGCKEKINLKIDTHYLGKINKEKRLSLLYNSADVFVCPSLEDNLPNTVIESLSSGTPVVGFKVGGIPDMIKHKNNGYLANYKDSNDLAKGINWCIENEERNKDLSVNARKKAEREYSLEIQANRYKKLFKDLIQ